MPTQTGSIDFASTGGFKSYATNKYATQSTVSQMQTAISQNATDISLRATKTEASQMAQPNLAPLGSADFASVYDATTNPKGYWKTTIGPWFTRLDDGWIHVYVDNTAGTAAVNSTSFRPSPSPSVVPGGVYTILTEIRKNASAGDASTDMYLQQMANNQFWGNVSDVAIDDEHVTTSTQIPLNTCGTTYVMRSYRIADTTHLTDGVPPSELFRYNFRCAVGAKLDFDFRMSLYDGIYDGPYKPYSGTQLYASQAELKVANDNISLKVSKNDVINQINVSTEGAQIDASKVQINGTAIFTAISSDVDSAITGKGYATTTQAQGYASTAKSEAISAAATDATTKANAAENNAKAYTDALEIGGRNLLPNSQDWSGAAKRTNGTIVVTSDTYGGCSVLTHVWGSGNSDVGYQGNVWTQPIEADTWYTLSFWAKASSNVETYSYFFSSNVVDKGINSSGKTTTSTDGAIKNSITTEWQRVWVSWHIKAGATAFPQQLIVTRLQSTQSGVTLYLAGPKLEKGNKATDWTPAPEDVDASINDISVGGRNLIVASKISNGYLGGNGSIGGMDATRKEGYSDYIPVSSGESLVFQAWVTVSASNTEFLWMAYEFYNSSKTYVGSRPSKVGGTVLADGRTYNLFDGITVPDGAAYIRVSMRRYDDGVMKLEKGNKPTDWTPAPEDIEANAVKRTQRIWYRKSTSGAPSTPGTASSNWVTKDDDGNDAWTKMHIAISSTHKYIYTCEQYEMANGTVGYTSVLLDNTITVIDGGNLITGSVTANKLDAANINASKSLTVGAMTDAAASTILNSNIQIGGRNLLTGSSDMTKCFTNLNKVTSIAGGYSDPDGGNNAYLITPNATSWYAGPAGGRLLLTSLTTSYTFSVWLRADSATQCKLCCRYMDTTPYSSNAARVTFDVTTEWQRYHISAPLKRAQTSDSIWIGQVTTTPIYVYHPMVEMSSNPSDWTPAPEDVESSIIEASKTASNYITADSTGIKIHMSGSTSTYQHQSSTATTYYVNGNKRAEVGTNGLKVYVGTTGTESSVAEFGTTARVGSASGPNVYVESGGVSVRDGTTGVVKFSGAAATGGYTRSSSVELAGWNGTALRMRGDTATDNRYIGLESGFGSLLAVRHTDSVTEYGSFEGNNFVELEAEGMSVNGTTVDMDKQVLPAFLTQGGMVAQSISATANAVTSYTVTFPIPYEASPIVTACFYSTSTAAAFGGLSLSVSAITTTSFTVKIFNNTGTGRTVGIFWIATPQTTLT